MEFDHPTLAIANGAPRPSQDEIRDMFGHAQGYQRLEPMTGAYEAMVSSGDLRLLRDQELRHVAAVLRHSELVPFLGTMPTVILESFSTPLLEDRKLMGIFTVIGRLASNHLRYFEDPDRRAGRIASLLARAMNSDGL
jgi:hypothetical protein